MDVIPVGSHITFIVANPNGVINDAHWSDALKVVRAAQQRQGIELTVKANFQNSKKGSVSEARAASQPELGCGFDSGRRSDRGCTTSTLQLQINHIFIQIDHS